MPENDTGVKLVIYKKIVAGDLSKFTATSNITQSGGGARDLRFNPADQFLTVFRKMFPRVSDNGVLTGYFSWANHANTEVEIHPPTNARPNEVRIGRIHECFPTQYIPDNDKEPFFDGHLYLYSDGMRDNKKYYLGRVPIQIKGKEVDDFIIDKWKFKLDKEDLEAYLHDPVFFVV